MLQTDRGTEFLGEPFQDVLSAMGTGHSTADVGDHNSLGIVDSFSRAIKRAVYARMTATDNPRWIDSIAALVRQYNESPHDTFPGSVTPDDVEEAANGGDEILLYRIKILNRRRTDQAVRSYRRFLGASLRVGERFRVRERKGRKGYEARWSGRVYEAAEIDGRMVVATTGERFPIKDTKEVGPAVQSTDNLEVRKAEGVKRARREMVRRDPAYSFKPRDQVSEEADERQQAQRALSALDPAYQFE